MPVEHPEAKRLRELAELRLRQIHALMWELARVQGIVGDIVTVDLNPPLRDGTVISHCLACAKQIDGRSANGNVRLYCDQRCQQRAYRARRKLGGTSHAA